MREYSIAKKKNQKNHKHAQASNKDMGCFCCVQKNGIHRLGNGGPYGQRGWVGLVAVRWAADPHAGSAGKLASDAAGGGLMAASLSLPIMGKAERTKSEDRQRGLLVKI